MVFLETPPSAHLLMPQGPELATGYCLLWERRVLHWGGGVESGELVEFLSEAYYICVQTCFFFKFFFFFLRWTIFKLLNLLQFCFCFLCVVGYVDMWVLTLQPGLNQHHSTSEGKTLTTGRPWKFLQFFLESYSCPVFAKLKLVFMEAILFLRSYLIWTSVSKPHREKSGSHKQLTSLLLLLHNTSVPQIKSR